MQRSPFSLAFSLSVGITLLSVACGSGSRQLQSVTLSPATADARSFPNGEVPFAATGTFSKPPSPQPLTNQDVMWCVGSSAGMCAGNTNPGATIDQNGRAQCVGSFVGTVNILAGKAQPSMNPDMGSQLTVFGAAKLTCP